MRNQFSHCVGVIFLTLSKQIILIVCNYKNNLYLPITEGSRLARLYIGRGASRRRSTAPTPADNKRTETAKATPQKEGFM
jgi:hypothetical protein